MSDKSKTGLREMLARVCVYAGRDERGPLWIVYERWDYVLEKWVHPIRTYHPDAIDHRWLTFLQRDADGKEVVAPTPRYETIDQLRTHLAERPEDHCIIPVWLACHELGQRPDGFAFDSILELDPKWIRGDFSDIDLSDPDD
jgi:hypothetical protein